MWRRYSSAAGRGRRHRQSRYLPAYTRITVKFGGPFAHLSIAKLEQAKNISVSLRNVFARYADCLLAQMFQSTACNAIHSIEQRTAKWIISAMERTNGDHIVPLTHEQLSTLLGVGRSYASRVIQTFKAEGLVETRRGSIVVRDVEGLRLRACQCNESVKNHFEEVLRGVYPSEAVRKPLRPVFFRARQLTNSQITHCFSAIP